MCAPSLTMTLKSSLRVYLTWCNHNLTPSASIMLTSTITLVIVIATPPSHTASTYVLCSCFSLNLWNHGHLYPSPCCHTRNHHPQVEMTPVPEEDVTRAPTTKHAAAVTQISDKTPNSCHLHWSRTWELPFWA